MVRREMPDMPDITWFWLTGEVADLDIIHNELGFLFPTSPTQGHDVLTSVLPRKVYITPQ